MSDQAIQDAVAKGVEAGVSAAIGDKSEFHIGREKHYKHHDFIDSAIESLDSFKETAFKTIIWVIVVGALGIFGLGVTVWIRTQGG